MKLKFIFLLLIVCCSWLRTKAQSSDLQWMPKYNAYAEVGTNIIVSSASLNVEVHFASSESQKIHWYGRGAFTGAAVFYGPAGWGGSAGVTMLTGQKNHHFEAGAGIFLGSDTGAGMGDGLFALPLLDLGYRWQKPQGGFLFRIKAGALGVGIGVGYGFKY